MSSGQSLVFFTGQMLFLQPNQQHHSTRSQKIGWWWKCFDLSISRQRHWRKVWWSMHSWWKCTKQTAVSRLH